MPRRKTKNLDQPVTVRDFREFTDFAAKTFLTKDEALATFLTKDEAFATFATKDEIFALRDDVLTGYDKLAKKLDTFLTEQVIIGHRVDNHEKRIIKLETRRRSS